MDRARSFATIGRALYMAHSAPRFPISVKVEERSRSPSERELCALQMDFTVSTKEEQRGAQADLSAVGLRVATCRLHLNLTCDIARIQIRSRLQIALDLIQVQFYI